MPDSTFAPVTYNNYTIKIYFLFRCTSVTINPNKVGFFGVDLAFGKRSTSLFFS